MLRLNDIHALPHEDTAQRRYSIRNGRLIRARHLTYDICRYAIPRAECRLDPLNLRLIGGRIRACLRAQSNPEILSCRHNAADVLAIALKFALRHEERSAHSLCRHLRQDPVQLRTFGQSAKGKDHRRFCRRDKLQTLDVRTAVLRMRSGGTICRGCCSSPDQNEAEKKQNSIACLLMLHCSPPFAVHRLRTLPIS